MSVTITTTFHDGSNYQTLSRVIFTSPNSDTPVTNSWRSHIIPGESALATWYSGSSFMYRIFNYQIPSVESYAYNTTASGFHMRNSVKFQVTAGECYDCRLTAWDDFSHSSTANHLISTDRVRASAVAYRWLGSETSPSSVVEVLAPKYNFIMKGNTTSGVNNNYYGDFNMIYATPTTTYSGDVCIFRPYLHSIDGTVTYGIHDYVATLHYSYT